MQTCNNQVFLFSAAHEVRMDWEAQTTLQLMIHDKSIASSTKWKILWIQKLKKG